MADKFLIGMEKVLKKVDAIGFHKQTKKKLLNSAARPAADLMKEEVQRLVVSGTDKYPYMDFIRYMVKKQVTKSKKVGGMTVFLPKSAVPVSPGKGRSTWSLRGYAMLTFFGNKDTKPRKHDSGKETGNVRGELGFNPFERAIITKGSKALAKFAHSIRLEINKQFRNG
jgi:hypothetical protein